MQVYVCDSCMGVSVHAWVKCGKGIHFVYIMVWSVSMRATYYYNISYNINLYNYIIQFVCLFVRDSRLNYTKNSHQSLRNHRDPPGRTSPCIGITRPVVSMAYSVYFRYSLRGWLPYINYYFTGFPVSTHVLKKTNQNDTQCIHRQKDNLKGMTKIKQVDSQDSNLSRWHFSYPQAQLGTPCMCSWCSNAWHRMHHSR